MPTATAWRYGLEDVRVRETELEFSDPMSTVCDMLMSEQAHALARSMCNDTDGSPVFLPIAELIHGTRDIVTAQLASLLVIDRSRLALFYWRSEHRLNAATASASSQRWTLFNRVAWTDRDADVTSETLMLVMMAALSA